MKTTTFLIIFVAFACIPSIILSRENVARIALLKGKVGKIVSNSEFVALSKGDLLDEGTTIKSMAKSFAKIVYRDKSQIILGPKSIIKIHKVLKGNVSMVSILRGSIRARVNKVKEEENESYYDKRVKLLLKTKTAAMGVRGTDFHLSYNPSNKMTALLTYSDVVSMSKIPDNIKQETLTASTLNSILDGPDTAHILEGKYSGTFPKFEKITYPSKISPSQFESLKYNEIPDFRPKIAKIKKYRSSIPDGVVAKAFISSPQELQNKIERTIGTLSYKAAIESARIKVPKDLDIDISPPEGLLDITAKTFAPTAGGYIDFPTALYIPPPPGSLFDPNTGTYTPPKTMGTADTTSGRYIAPPGRELTTRGELRIIDEKLAKTVTPPPRVKVVDMKIYKVEPNIIKSLRAYINEMRAQNLYDQNLKVNETNIEDEIEDLIDEVGNPKSEIDNIVDQYNNDFIIIERTNDTDITLGVEVAD